MKFAKEYSQILVTLPPEFQATAIDYRKLKKLIKFVVDELESLGLGREVLQGILQRGSEDCLEASHKVKTDRWGDGKLVYELNGNSEHIVPRLRMTFSQPDPDIGQSESSDGEESTLNEADGIIGGSSSSILEKEGHQKALLWVLAQDLHGATHRIGLPLEDHGANSLLKPLEQHGSQNLQPPAESTPNLAVPADTSFATSSPPSTDFIIPLPSDATFFNVLVSALQALAVVRDATRSQFEKTLASLSRTVSSAAVPAHTNKTSHIFPLGGSLVSFSRNNKSDLDAWRQIFQLYVELSIFESTREKDKGKLDVVEAEKRLGEFTRGILKIGFGDGRNWRRKESQGALGTFLQLNVTILNIKKFQHASAEAARKILKKHAKLTALSTYTDTLTALIPYTTPSNNDTLSHILLVQLTETLLPVVPHIDDYLCAICTSIAFKPVRLDCSHLFCVRCMVKMQRARKGHCPICRAPTVLTATTHNLDLALINFMLDWFPEETREKNASNIKERQREDLDCHVQ